MRKIAGYTILLLFFAAMFTVLCLQIGLLKTVAVFFGAGLTSGLLIYAIYLISVEKSK